MINYCARIIVIRSYLQSDLNLIFAWSRSWLMWFNVNKCVTLTECNRSLQPISFTYYLNVEPLNCVTDHSYLARCMLTSSMSFSSHINNIVSKASKTLSTKFSSQVF